MRTGEVLRCLFRADLEHLTSSILSTSRLDGGAQPDGEIECWRRRGAAGGGGGELRAARFLEPVSEASSRYEWVGGLPISLCPLLLVTRTAAAR